MNLPSSPLAWIVIIALSIVSTYVSWIGLRQRNVAFVLIGIGLGVPTFDVTDYRCWLAGASLCALGAWIHRKLTGI